ncbi:MAG: hypothetical protein CL610_06130 [Anaerolineaceae bacterium]|nr:hypothetical protein [Anaerolineaceae bacterium]
MYNGPFYLHQPGYGDFSRVSKLLNEGVGDGVVVFADAAKRTSEKKFPEYLAAFRSSGKQMFIDTEQYDPAFIGAEVNPDGSKALLDFDVCHQYVASSLALQHDNQCNGYIIPNVETSTLSPSWYELTRVLCATSTNWIDKHGDGKLPLMLTIAVPAGFIADAESRLELLNHLTWLKSFVRGYYINLIDVPEILTDTRLIHGLLDMVFRLKRQKVDIVFARVGGWVPTLFPLGLDYFANGSTKSLQRFQSKRDPRKTGGSGPVNYVNIWSPLTMSYVKYPEEADVLHKELSQDQLQRLYGTDSGYAPPVDRKPESVFYSKGYNQPRRLNHFSATQARLANQYRGRSFSDRIVAVEKTLSEAYRNDQELGKLFNNPNRGQEKKIWLDTFNRFVEENRFDLEDLYD